MFAQDPRSGWRSRLLQVFGHEVAKHGMAGAEQGHSDVAILESRISHSSDLAVIDGEYNEISMALHAETVPFTCPSRAPVVNIGPGNQVYGLRHAEALGNELGVNPWSQSDQQRVITAVVQSKDKPCSG
jgi:hypothetical protein